jgi:hypothetical protein
MALEPNEISLDDYNRKITEWGESTGRKIRDSISMLTSKGKGALLRSLRLKTGKWYGEVDRLAYHFDRHGVFVHKGVGRGYAMVGGKVMRVSGSLQVKFLKEYARNKNRTYNPKPVNGTMERKPVEWFNPVLTRNIDKLADMVAEMNADRAVNATSKILIR